MSLFDAALVLAEVAPVVEKGLTPERWDVIEVALCIGVFGFGVLVGAEL